MTAYTIRSMLTISTATLRPAYGVLLLVLTVLVIPGAQSQELDPMPLAPPDTSSPRATLKSFRDSMELAFRSFYERRDSSLLGTTAAENRAIDCLDASQLPPVRSRRLATEAALILNDVLEWMEG